MLVEPGMLLMYKSTEKRSWITDMLVEFLGNYVRNYDPSRCEEAMKSVQRVLRDCERKGVVGSIPRDMINSPKLKPKTQMILKEFYMASERIKARQDDSAFAPADPLGGLSDTNKFGQEVVDRGAYEQEIANEEGAGQFSPTYITNEAALKLEENSAFAGEAHPFEPRSPSFEREDSLPEASNETRKT